MGTTVTDTDIRSHYVIPALGHDADDYDVDAIVTELLAAYPVSEWTYADLQYGHPSGCPDFWEIVDRHERTDRSGE